MIARRCRCRVCLRLGGVSLGERRNRGCRGWEEGGGMGPVRGWRGWGQEYRKLGCSPIEKLRRKRERKRRREVEKQMLPMRELQPERIDREYRYR